MILSFSMKRTLLALTTLCTLVLLPLSASAMTVAGGDQYELPSSVTVNDDVYALGGTLIANGAVNGDLVAAGGNIMVNNRVSQDVLAAGGNLTILGDVGDDVRAVGGSLVIGKEVKGDVVSAAGTFTLLKDAVIDGDLVVAGGDVTINGTVKGYVKVVGGKVTINGTIGDEVDIKAGQTVSFGPNAKAAKAIRYTAPQEAMLDPMAVLQVKPEFTLLERPDRNMQAMGVDKKKAGGWLSGLLLLGFVFRTFALIVATMVLISLMPKAMQDIVTRGIKAPGKVLLDGFVWSVVPPLAGLLLVLTLIGALLGAVVFVGFGLMVVLAKIVTALVAGAWLFHVFSKNKEISLDFKTAVIGSLLIMALSLVPIIGWILVLLSYLLAMGGISGLVMEYWNSKKK
jgi:phage baseplate assembly protein gpV